MHEVIQRHNKLDSTYIKLKKKLYGEIGRFGIHPQFKKDDLKHLKKLLNKEIKHYTFTFKIMKIKRVLESLRR